MRALPATEVLAQAALAVELGKCRPSPNTSEMFARNASDGRTYAPAAFCSATRPSPAARPYSPYLRHFQTFLETLSIPYMTLVM